MTKKTEKIQDSRALLMEEDMNFAKFEILKMGTGDWTIKNEV